MTATAIDTDVLQFLQDILVRRVPDRDVTRAAQLGLQSKQIYPDGAPEEVLQAWLLPSVSWLSAVPARWNMAIGMTALYLDEHFVSPRTGQSMGSRLATMLLAANKEAQARFFASLSDWSAVRAVEDIIPALDLEREAALAMIGKWFAPQEPNTLSGLSSGVVASWAVAHPRSARELVDEWRAADARHKPFSVEALATLVEGIMQAVMTPVQREEHLTWRAEVLGELASSMAEKDQQLAAHLSFSAWPTATPAEQQHEALLAFLRRSPTQLASAGLSALVRVIRETKHATIAFDTLAKISRLVQQARPTSDRWQQHLGELAHVIWLGLSETSESKPELAQIEPFLGELLQLEPVSRERIRSFDYLVVSLWKLFPERATSLMTNWLRGHAERLSGRIEDSFPLLASNARGPLDSWLVSWLVDDSPAVRVYAARVVGYRETPSLDVASIQALKTNQAQALVHMLLAAHMAPEPLLHLLQEAASLRADLVALVGEQVRNELAIDYPGATRRWAERTANAPDVPAELGEIARQLNAWFAQRDDLLQKRITALPELRGTWPTQRETAIAQQEMVSQQMRQHESPLMQMVTKMPIARGEGSAGPRVSPTQFQQHKFEVEVAARTFTDRVTAQLLPFQHQQRATELLSAREDG